MKIPANNPEIVVRDGKPVAVILDIDVYEEMLERVEGVEDLEYLREVCQKKLDFRPFDDFLRDYSSGVQGSVIKAGIGSFSPPLQLGR